MLDRAADGFLAKRAGADGWLVKPFTARDLREALAEAMRIAGPWGKPSEAGDHRGRTRTRSG